MDKIPRMTDPLWVRCCELWDRLGIWEHDLLVKAMEYMAEEAAEKEQLSRLGGGEEGGDGQDGEG